MVDLADIPDFPGLPGQRPTIGAPPTVTPIAVVLVTAPMDAGGSATPLNAAAVDTFITAETEASRAYVTTVERWSPWSALDLPLGFDAASRYNYGRFTIDGRHFYAYLDVAYQNLTTSTFVPSPDDWCTYAPTIGYSTVVRGHIAVAASVNDTYGDQYLTAPEPIDAPPARSILAGSILDATTDPSTWKVVVVSTNDLRGSGGTPYFEVHVFNSDINNADGFASDATANSAGSVQITVPRNNYPWANGPTTYVPKVTPSPVSMIDGVAAGGGVYLFTSEGYAEFLTIMQGAPWVIDGIVSVSIVPSWAVSAAGGAGHSASTPPTNPTSGSWGAASGIPVFVSELNTSTISVSDLNDWRTTVSSLLGSGIYRKILTSQFTRIIVSDGDNEHEFLPEVWKTGALGFDVVTETPHGVPTIRAVPNGYTDLGKQRGIEFLFGGSGGTAKSGYGMAASNTAQSDIGPWLSAYSAFTSRLVLIDQKALAIALGFTQARLNMGAQGIQTVLGAALGATGGPAGAALSGASGLASLATSAISTNNSLDILDMSQDGSFDIATYQLGLSGIGSYFAFDTWVQSLNSTSGRGSPHGVISAWRAIIGRGLALLITTPTADSVARALTMFQRFGYMIGRSFVPPRMDAMDHYTYWQLDEPTILGALPSDAKQRIAERFTRGTTIWANVADIGTNPANTPNAGISY